MYVLKIMDKPQLCSFSLQTQSYLMTTFTLNWWSLDVLAVRTTEGGDLRFLDKDCDLDGWIPSIVTSKGPVKSMLHITGYHPPRFSPFSI